MGVWVIFILVGIDDLYEGTYWRFCVDKAAFTTTDRSLLNQLAKAGW